MPPRALTRIPAALAPRFAAGLRLRCVGRWPHWGHLSLRDAASAPHGLGRCSRPPAAFSASLRAQLPRCRSSRSTGAGYRCAMRVPPCGPFSQKTTPRLAGRPAKPGWAPLAGGSEVWSSEGPVRFEPLEGQNRPMRVRSRSAHGQHPQRITCCGQWLKNHPAGAAGGVIRGLRRYCVSILVEAPGIEPGSAHVLTVLLRV